MTHRKSIFVTTTAQYMCAERKLVSATTPKFVEKKIEENMKIRIGFAIRSNHTTGSKNASDKKNVSLCVVNCGFRNICLYVFVEKKTLFLL